MTSTNSLPKDIAFGVLRQTHPEYTLGIWTELQDFYLGGYHLLQRTGAYVPPQADESQTRYGDRLKSIGYINYLGQIIDYYVSALFSQELQVTDAPDSSNPNTPGELSDPTFYAAFESDADLGGTAFASVIRDAFRDAILLKRALVCVDFPDVGQQATTRLEEESLGANRAYVYRMPLEQLVNWEVDRYGLYKFCVAYTLSSNQDSPADFRGGVLHHEFKIWTIEHGGFARWDRYAIDQTKTEPIDPKMPVPWIDGGETSFRRIPILSFELRDGLWVGNKVGPLAKEHFARRSILVEAENKSMMAVPYVKRGPEIGAIGGEVPSMTQQDSNRGSNPVRRFQNSGWVALGAGDDLGFAEPEGKAYQIVSAELHQLKDEMHRVVHQMAASVDNKASSTRRSGDSKKQERVAEAIILTQFGKDIREFSRVIYKTISDARREDIVWVTRGLDRFESDDRETLLAEAIQVDMVRIPSTTFLTEYKTQLAFRLVENLNAQTADVIRAEIVSGVKKDLAASEALKKAALEAPMPAVGLPTKDDDAKPIDDDTKDDA